MKRFNLWLLALIMTTSQLSAQVGDSLKPCRDFVHLKDGSKLSGTLVSYDETKGVVLRLDSGNECSLGIDKVKKITQDCEGSEYDHKPIRLKEKGLILQSTLSVLPGRSAWSEISLGSSLKVGLYYQVNHRLAVGGGVGAEIYTPEAIDEVINYPLFGEVIFSPAARSFISAGAGYSFTGNKKVQDWNRQIYDIDGGQYYSVAYGHRLGNHLSAIVGFQLVQKTKNWNTIWNIDNHGSDRITHKRFSFGLTYTL
ncbi:MAG: hypothetical protein IPN29_05025 [Saprospiraceae bacterium]|nr:hypothetical protein [Saprospiraceae bacterium]